MRDKTVRTARQAGFTLIELLVVIAIVAVIAAILFPVFAGVRERGRRTVCQSNLKQIATAMQQYVQDNGGTYPLPFYARSVPPYSASVTWANGAYTYLKNTEVFRCPDKGETISDQLILDPSSVTGSYRLDYTYDNPRLSIFLPPYPTKNVQGTHESMLVTPSTIWLNVDGSSVTSDGVWHDGREGPKSSCGRSGGGSTLHSGAGNYSFVDGHVKWLTPEEAGEVECANGPLPAPFKD